MDKEIAYSVVKNTTIQFGQQIVTWASSFVLMMFLPRYLGPERYGRLYLAETIAAMFLVLIAYDGRFSIAKRISRNRESAPEILADSLVFRRVFWLFSFIGMIAFSYLAGYPEATRIIIFIFGIELLWVSARVVYAGTFLGFENTLYTAITAITERLFVAAGGITALLLGGDEITVAIVMATGTLINFLMCTRYMKRFIPPLPRVDWGRVRQLIVEGFPFLLWTVFGMIYYRIDTVMLSVMVPGEVIGWYGAAYKFYDVLAFLPSIFTLAILPVLSKLYGRQKEMLADTTQKSINFIFIAGIPVSIGVFMFSPQIINFFFGITGYSSSIHNLKIFSVGILLLYLDMVLGTAIIANDKQRQLATISFFAILMNVGLNYFMIPIAQARAGNGGIGAAVATVITEFFMMVSMLSILPKSSYSTNETGIMTKSLISGILMIVVLNLTARFIPDAFWMLRAAIGGGAYLSGLLILRTFTPGEIAYVREFLSREKIRDIFSSGRRRSP